MLSWGSNPFHREKQPRLGWAAPRLQDLSTTNSPMLMCIITRLPLKIAKIANNGPIYHYQHYTISARANDIGPTTSLTSPLFPHSGSSVRMPTTPYGHILERRSSLKGTAGKTILQLDRYTAPLLRSALLNPRGVARWS